MLAKRWSTGAYMADIGGGVSRTDVEYEAEAE